MVATIHPPVSSSIAASARRPANPAPDLDPIDSKPLDMDSSARFLTLPNGSPWYQLGHSALYVRDEYDRLFHETVLQGFNAIAVLGTAGVGKSVMHVYWIYKYLKHLLLDDAPNLSRPHSYPEVRIRLRREHAPPESTTDHLVVINLQTRTVQCQPYSCSRFRAHLCLVHGYQKRIQGEDLHSYGDIIIVTAADHAVGKFHTSADAAAYPFYGYRYITCSIRLWSYSETLALMRHLAYAEADVRQAYAVLGGSIRWVLSTSLLLGGSHLSTLSQRLLCLLPPQ